MNTHATIYLITFSLWVMLVGAQLNEVGVWPLPHSAITFLIVHSKLPNVTHVATKVDVMLRRHAVLTWTHYNRELV